MRDGNSIGLTHRSLGTKKVASLSLGPPAEIASFDSFWSLNPPQKEAHLHDPREQRPRVVIFDP